jgi:hypothetical protein
MPDGSDRPYVDPLSLTDLDTYLYETIATLSTQAARRAAARSQPRLT